jgi:hypothetical protein
MKKKFKYAIGERVFVNGVQGTSKISARGLLNFESGGKMNFYCLLGANTGTFPENILESIEERKKFNEIYNYI